MIIGYGNVIEAATMSGGSWETTLPAANVKSRELAKVARSTDAAAASTILIADFGAEKPIKLLGIVNHQCSEPAQYRLTLANDSGFSTDLVYEGSTTDVYPVVYSPDALEWEDDNWWTGKYSAEDLEDRVLQKDIVLDRIYRCRYLKLEIFDDTNPDGYVQIGYLVAMSGWTTIRGEDVGAALGLETSTEITEAVGGSEVIDEQPRYRRYTGTLSQMGEDEAFGNAFEVMRRIGTGQPIYVIPDPADERNALRRNFLGRFSELNPIVHRHAGRMSLDFSIREWTA